MTTYIPPINTKLTVSMRPKLEWCHADTCLPDYWSGHHLPHVQIAVDNSTTIGDVRAAIRREIRDGAIMGNCDIARLLGADIVRENEEALANAFTRAAYAAVNKIKATKRRPFTHLSPSTGDDDETVWAYFVLRDEE